MKTKLIISFFIALCAFSSALPNAHAQKKKETPATHMWVKTGLSTLVFVSVRSLEQCEMLTQQAARLNSAESACFNNREFLKEISCTKPVKRNQQANCS